MGNKCFVNVGKKCLTFTKHMQLGYKLSIFYENAFILFFSVTFDSSKDILLLLVNFANLYHTESSFSLHKTDKGSNDVLFRYSEIETDRKGNDQNRLSLHILEIVDALAEDSDDCQDNGPPSWIIIEIRYEVEVTIL